ncbi:MAG TPA: UDP-N-acetylmuramoyl-L-alanine--D-glutamate ligase [Candidatus Paceibacterota bacterium]|nr:UDP-N-acetylmuramoyl-L-alanine--D-glutamate ligase [Candidatus Paceibacterota bacterium]HPV33518.1 UDP-N-acetylmuramoyl-L-alanine--D-glutamate ligase [Candidatus Paceibacterota bacterium]
MNYKTFFKNKKITIVGLGLLGRGIGVVKFLAKNGADLIVTDLKTKEQLSSSLKKLAVFKNIKYVLGEHRLEDFRNRDMVIKAAGVPLDSPFIAEAKKNKIPIEMDASLFAKLAPTGVKIIGVTGTRGKSMVTHLLYEILKENFGSSKVHLGGNVRGIATLPLLKKVKPGDFVVMELDSWQLQGFGESRLSPPVSLFTTFLSDHQNYYKNSMEQYFADKANIYRWQTKDGILLARPQAVKIIKEKDKAGIKGRFKVVKKSDLPANWKHNLLGEHNLENIALALSAARELGALDKVSKKAIAAFPGLPGRLEFIKEKGGIKYYNDTNATTPDAVLVALAALKKYKGKIILLGGGADKNLDYATYAKAVRQNVKALALFRGTATDKILEVLWSRSVLGRSRTDLGQNKVEVFDNIREAFAWAKAQAKRGDIILLSPGAASFGVFKNEYDRGDQFNKLVKRI